MTYAEYSKIRDDLGVTDYAVSTYTGISRATLSQWKNGKTTPSRNTMNQLIFFLDTFKKKVSDYNVDISIDKLKTADAQTVGNNLLVEDFNIRTNPPLRIDGYYVSLKCPPVELTEKEYEELKMTTEAFAITWLKIHNKIVQTNV